MPHSLVSFALCLILCLKSYHAYRITNNLIACSHSSLGVIVFDHRIIIRVPVKAFINNSMCGLANLFETKS